MWLSAASSEVSVNFHRMLNSQMPHMPQNLLTESQIPSRSTSFQWHFILLLLTACVIHKNLFLSAGIRPQGSNLELSAQNDSVTKCQKEKRALEGVHQAAITISFFLYSLPFSFSQSGERKKKTPLSTQFNSMRLQHAAQTGRGRVFVGINSWQHTEVLPTCATAQKSCVNSEGEQDALGRVTTGLSSCGPIENHTQSSGCSLEAPWMNSLGF